MKRFVQVTLIMVVLLVFAGVVGASPVAQDGDMDGVPYTVQPGDGLIQLARLYLGDGSAYLLIIDATNAMAAADSSYGEITDPNIILVGQKIFIPGLDALPQSADVEEETAALEELDQAAADTEMQEDAMADTDETQAAGADLAGTSWLMTSLEGAPPVEDTTVTLEFASESEAAGNSGCNGYGGTYEADGFHISFGPLVGTLIACPEPIMEQETAFRTALEEAAYYTVTSDGLRLFDSERTMRVQFAPASTELAGTSWDVINYNNGREAVVSVLLDTSLTAVFGADGQLSGSAGCNNYFGPYSAADGTIEIGALASTRKLCSEEGVMEQESEFLAAMETAATYRITGDRLELRDADGAMVANMTLAQ